MNPLLTELHRYYADQGIPPLVQQAHDLMALAARRHQERQQAAIRAVNGYARTKKRRRK